MQAGDAVRYKGKPVEVGGHDLVVGTKGEVIGTHRVEELWLAVQWENMTRPTFHLQKELEVIRGPS